jgi:hypothetical protein
VWGVAGAVVAIIVAIEVFDWSGLFSVLALPIAGYAVHRLQRSLKCPGCGENEELDMNGDCRNCGAVLSLPK